MFFTKYTTLSADDMLAKFGAQPCPASVSPLFAGLAGDWLTARFDSGLTLKLSASSENALTVQENDDAPIAAAYKAMKLREALLLHVMIPGTLRSWNLVIDTKTRAATAFEIWFDGGDPLPAREAQREIHRGYITCAKSADPVEVRHKTTNRLENKGIYWKDDCDCEELDFFPSVSCASFVELNRPRGGLTIVNPADYLKISDNLYIFSRVECEFSGTLVLDVIDLYKVEKIGLRIGFDENDALDYRMYRACGKITGQGAILEKLNDYGDAPAPMMRRMPAGMPQRKGMRMVYRPSQLHPIRDLTIEQVREMVAKNGYHEFDLIGGFAGEHPNLMELTDYMVGKTFIVRYDDGTAWEYSVQSTTSLSWRVVGEEAWQETGYQGFEIADELVVFSHFHKGDPYMRCVCVCIDFKNRLSTCVDAWLGNSLAEYQVAHRAIFGVLEMDGVEPPRRQRQSFTTELVGKMLAWNYNDSVSSMHVYSSPDSYSWTIYTGSGAGSAMWSSPCFYVKLREDAYLMSWTEDGNNGSQGTLVFNPNLMHDVGFFYQFETDYVKLHSFGAYARRIGELDILPYFENKNR